MDRIKLIIAGSALASAALLAPCLSHAATIDIVEPKEGLKVGEKAMLQVTIDPQGSSVNAVSGSIALSAADFKVERAVTTGSFVDLWIERPEVSLSSGSYSVSWAGIVPGGFEGVQSPFYKGKKEGILLSIELVPLRVGPAAVSFVAVDARANDGEGSQVSLSAPLRTLSVSSGTGKAGSASPIASEAPSDIVARIAQSPYIASNKWFLAFAEEGSRGSASGFEVAESADADASLVPASLWRPAQIPYVLRDQSRRSYVHVRQVSSDEASRAVTIPPSSEPGSQNGIWVIIICICILGTYAFSRRSRR